MNSMPTSPGLTPLIRGGIEAGRGRPTWVWLTQGPCSRHPHSRHFSLPRAPIRRNEGFPNSTASRASDSVTLERCQEHSKLCSHLTGKQRSTWTSRQEVSIQHLLCAGRRGAEQSWASQPCSVAASGREGAAIAPCLTEFRHSPNARPLAYLRACESDADLPSWGR